MTPYQIDKATRGERDVKRTRAKKTKRQVAVKHADDWFAKYIKARDRYCVTCGSDYMLQCSHLFQGRHYSTRWREDCAFAQCKGCHHSHHNKSQLLLIRYAEKGYSPAWVDELKRRDNEKVDMSSDEIMALGDKYRELVRGME